MKFTVRFEVDVDAASDRAAVLEVLYYWKDGKTLPEQFIIVDEDGNITSFDIHEFKHE